MSEHEDDAPPAFEPSVRISASIEPEAARMLDELVARLYPDKRASQARALVLEMGIRMLHTQVIAGDQASRRESKAKR